MQSILGFLTARWPQGSHPAHVEAPKASVLRETRGRYKDFFDLSLKVTSLSRLQRKKRKFYLLMRGLSKLQSYGRYYYDHLWKKQPTTQTMINPAFSYMQLLFPVNLSSLGTQYDMIYSPFYSVTKQFFCYMNKEEIQAN